MTDMFVVLMDEKVKSDVQAELRVLRRRGKKGKRGLAPHERDMFGYLMRRAVVHRAVEGSELDRLVMADRAVVEARSIMNMGRGNVGDDIDKTDRRSTWHTEAARILMKKLLEDARWLSIEETAATAAASILALRAGNCSEHADMVTVLAGPKLKRGQTAHVVESTERGHQWSELRVNGREPDPRDIVMDAWAEGPAVFRGDSEYARSVGPWMSSYHLDRRAANRVWKRMDELVDRIQSDDMQASIQESLTSLEEKNFSYNERWPLTSVMSEEFSAKTDERLNTLKSNEAGRMLLQITAAGVARQFKRNVKQAAAEAHRWLLPPED
jgi:hypothetical protein